LYYISNKRLLEECDTEENVAVTVAATTSVSEIRLYSGLSHVMHSTSHRHAGAPMINIQSTLRTAPDLCKNVSFAVLFGSNGTSYSLYAVRYVYIHIFFTI
jgi:hypothetical protein